MPKDTENWKKQESLTIERKNSIKKAHEVASIPEFYEHGETVIKYFVRICIWLCHQVLLFSCFFGVKKRFLC